jgi:hypothetical protein
MQASSTSLFSTPPAPSISIPFPSPQKGKAPLDLFLRGLLFFAIVIAGGLSSGLSFYFIRKAQILSTHNDFFTMTSNHFNSFQDLLHLQLHLNIELATAFSLQCPHAEDWPNCGMPSAELEARTRSLLEPSAITQFLIAPIVQTEQRQSFESFADHFLTRNTSSLLNRTELLKGIVELLPENGGHRSRSPNHTDPLTLRYDFLVPIFLMSDTRPDAATAGLSMANLYSPSDLLVSHAIEEILECVQQNSSSLPIGQRTSPGAKSKSAIFASQQRCSLLIDFSQGSEYSSIILTPIFASAAGSGREVVGFAAAGFSWRDALIQTIDPDSDFEFSIGATTAHATIANPVHTYRIDHDGAHEKVDDNTDSTNRRPSNPQLQKVFLLRPEPSLTTGSSYTITYRSSRDLPSQFFALITCLCCIVTTIGISSIFICFMILTDREFLASKVLLEAKRVYVRFISHEIRSLLST